MRSLAVIVPVAILNQCLPEGDPPEAYIETTCLDEECLLLELSAAETVNGEDYEWYVDGTFYDDGVTTQIELEPRGLVDVELLALNQAGSSTARQNLFTTQVVTPQPEPQPPVATVVIGAQACGGYGVITTVGGCFAGPAPLKTDFVRISNGVQQPTQTFTYEPATNLVTNGGTAIGGVFRNSNFATTQSYYDPNTSPNHPRVTNNYGPPPNYFRNVVGPSQDHLTTYWDMPVGDELRFESGHLAYLGDEERTPLDALSLDCSSGTLSVTAIPPSN